MARLGDFVTRRASLAHTSKYRLGILRSGEMMIDINEAFQGCGRADGCFAGLLTAFYFSRAISRFYYAVHSSWRCSMRTRCCGALPILPPRLHYSAQPVDMLAAACKMLFTTIRRHWHKNSQNTHTQPRRRFNSLRAWPPCINFNKMSNHRLSPLILMAFAWLLGLRIYWL